jgi:metal-responsive CopG/Arc/MetJ family transcriptional regulator
LSGGLKNSPLDLKVMQAVEIEENLLAEVDAVVKKLSKSRTEFVQEALREALRRQLDAEKIKRFVESYERIPQQPEEYEVWQDEQVWDNK